MKTPHLEIEYENLLASSPIMNSNIESKDYEIGKIKE